MPEILIKYIGATLLFMVALHTIVLGEETKPLDPALKAQLVKEKAYRKACKVKMCDALRNRKAEGEDIQCHIIKTLTHQDMQELVSKGKVSWPWGKVYCETNLKVGRQQLASALQDGKQQVNLDTHRISCTIEKKSGEPGHKIQVSIAPNITFENGTAVDAKVSWGMIEAPALAKGVIWPIAKLDNQFNFLKSNMLKTVNAFTTKKCDEVKDELGK